MKIFKSHGIRGLMKGFVANIYREIVLMGFFFYFYEMISQSIAGDCTITNEKAKIDPMTSIVAGGSTGILSWLIAYPIDALKSIAQTESLSKPRWTNYRHMVSDILARKGYLSLYKGLDVCMYRAFPVNAVVFLCYEASRNIMSDIYSDLT